MKTQRSISQASYMTKGRPQISFQLQNKNIIQPGFNQSLAVVQIKQQNQLVQQKPQIKQNINQKPHIIGRSQSISQKQGNSYVETQKLKQQLQDQKLQYLQQQKMYDIQLVPNAIAQKKKRPVSSTVFARASSVGSSSQANKQKLLANNIQQSYPTNFDLFKQQQLDNSAKKLSENIYKAPHDDVFDNSHYFKRFRSSSAQTRKPQNSPIKQKPVDLKRKSVTIGISFIEQQQQKAQIDNLAEVQLGLNDLDLESDNDILSALEKLETQTKNFNIKSITLQQYNQPLKSNLIINQLKTVPRSSIINESRIKQQPQTTIRNQKQRVQSKNRDAVQYQQIIKDSCTKFTAIQSSNDVFIEFEKQVNSQSQQRAKQKFDQQEKAKYYKKVAGTDPLYMIEPDREFEPTINRQLKDYYVKKYDKIEQTEKKVDKALKDYLVKRQKGLLIK